MENIRIVKHASGRITEVKMSVSAVQEILNAEAEARKIKEAASAQAKKTISDAHAEGQRLLAEAEKEAALASVKKGENTKSALEKSDAEKDKELSSKIALLKKAAEEKTPSAIDFIIKNI